MIRRLVLQKNNRLYLYMVSTKIVSGHRPDQNNVWDVIIYEEVFEKELVEILSRRYIASYECRNRPYDTDDYLING